MNTKSCHFNNGDNNGNINNGEIIYAVEHKLCIRRCARYSGVEMDKPCFHELTGKYSGTSITLNSVLTTDQKPVKPVQVSYVLSSYTES